MITYIVRVDETSEPTSPRLNFNFGKMVCWHDLYCLGDTRPSISSEDWLLEMANSFNHAGRLEITKVPKAFKELKRHFVLLPLYLFTTPTLSMSTTGYLCRLDSGHVGYIYAEVAAIKAEYGWKCMNKHHRELIEDRLVKEVAAYSQYLKGVGFGFEIDRVEVDVDGTETVLAKSMQTQYGFSSREEAAEAGQAALDAYMPEVKFGFSLNLDLNGAQHA